MRNIVVAMFAAVYLCMPHSALEAEAPSFDCAKASTFMEKTICQESSLAIMDRRLASTYKLALAGVSEEGRASLRDGQRQWIKTVNLICDTRPLPNEFIGDPKQCFKGQYSAREKQLEMAVQVFGNVKIRRVDIFSARRASSPDDDTGNPPGFVSFAKSYPQIDAPKSPSEKLFNTKIAAFADELTNGSTDDSPETDASLDYDLLPSTDKLRSISFGYGWYHHQTAHGSGVGSVFHWLISGGRELVADDVFAEDSSWKETLRDYCFREISHVDGNWLKTPDDLGDMPADPRRWVFETSGLTIRFNPYEVAAFAMGEPKVAVPWNVLKPYLKATAPIDPP